MPDHQQDGGAGDDAAGAYRKLLDELELVRRVEAWLREQLRARDENEARLRQSIEQLEVDKSELNDSLKAYARDFHRLHQRLRRSRTEAEPAPSAPPVSLDSSSTEPIVSSPEIVSQSQPTDASRALLLWWMRSLAAALALPERARERVAHRVLGHKASEDGASGERALAGAIVFAALAVLMAFGAYSCGVDRGRSAQLSNDVVIASSGGAKGCFCGTPSVGANQTVVTVAQASIVPSSPVVSSSPMALPRRTPGAIVVGSAVPTMPVPLSASQTYVATASVDTTPTPLTGAAPSPSRASSSSNNLATSSATATPVRETRAALQAAASGAAITAPPDPGRIAPGPGPAGTVDLELILDASGSMNEPALPTSGATTANPPKIVEAKNVATRLVDAIPSGVNFALRVYGHRLTDDDQAASCADIELIQRLGPPNRPQLDQAIRSLQAKGWTPLAKALAQAMNDFGSNDTRDAIVLISDGVETCGGNPLDAANRLQRHQPPITLYTIGFGVDAAARRQLQEMAKIGGGTYADATDARSLSTAIQDVLTLLRATRR